MFFTVKMQKWALQIHLGFQILIFGTVLFIRVSYYGLPHIIRRVTIYVTVLLLEFGAIYRSYYFQHITRSVNDKSVFYFTKNIL